MDQTLVTQDNNVNTEKSTLNRPMNDTENMLPTPIDNTLTTKQNNTNDEADSVQDSGKKAAQKTINTLNSDKTVAVKTIMNPMHPTD